MKRTFLILSVVLASVALQSCDNDDDHFKSVPTEAQNAFTAKYPLAARVDWDYKGNYYVADFYENGIEASAWFDANGMWYMTEFEIPFTALPEQVKTAFQSSEYASWKIDDIDMLTRKEMDVVYILEIENGNQEVNLHYSSEGILIKTTADGDENHVPQMTPSLIEAFIQEKYPDARILEIENEKGMWEVDILDNHIQKSVYFDLQHQWVYTSWDVRTAELPELVLTALTNAYAGYYIDDAEYVEHADGAFYLIELEKGNHELKVKLDAAGNFLN